jgi:hypothetical protein
MRVTTDSGSPQAVQTPPGDIDSQKQEAYALENSSDPQDRMKGHQMLMQLLAEQHDDVGGNSGPALTGPPRYTFGAADNPSYNPTIDRLAAANGTSDTLDSSNGQVAANAILRMEKSGAFTDNPALESQLVAQALANHKDDPTFLQQFLGTLGVDRTAKDLRNFTKAAGYGEKTDPAQYKQQCQDIGVALSTMVKSNVLSQTDMDRLVGQFANNPDQNFAFAKDVLSQASPEVNEMFYQSAIFYAMTDANTPKGNAMALYAAQALSQTTAPYEMDMLNQLQKDGKLSTFVQAVMQGQAQYSDQSADPSPFDGLSRLMVDVTHSGAQDPDSPPLLSNDDAHAIEETMFKTSMAIMDGETQVNGPSNSDVERFYRKDPTFKDALSAIFTSDYDGIVRSYTGTYNGVQRPSLDQTSGNGRQAFQEFFKTVLFSPPAGNDASNTLKFFMGKLNRFVSDSNAASNPNDSTAQQTFQKNHNGMPPGAYAQLMGEQAGALTAALAQAFKDVKDKDDAEVKPVLDVLDSVLTQTTDTGAVGDLAHTNPYASEGIALLAALVNTPIHNGFNAFENQLIHDEINKFNGVPEATTDWDAYSNQVTQYYQDGSGKHFDQTVKGDFMYGLKNALDGYQPPAVPTADH